MIGRSTAIGPGFGGAALQFPHDACRQERHLIYSRPGNPIEQIIHALPGEPDRDTTLDFLGEMITRRDEGK